jgi:hypothetical protein
MLETFRNKKAIYLLPYFFLAFEITTSIITITRPTRKKAHHMPALKMVSIAPQLLRTSIVNNNRNKPVFIFITIILPTYKFQVLYQFYLCLLFLHTGEFNACRRDLIIIKR